MKFEKYQVYDFKYAGINYQNGTAYFLLTYDGQNTMPGYEHNKWVFRTEVLEFQQNWGPDDIWETFPCYVANYMQDVDGSVTSFPVLKQDINAILKGFFDVGESYPFTICGCPGDLDKDGKDMKHYVVRDHLGFEHHLQTDAVYKIGDSVDLTVNSHGATFLIFMDPVNERLKELFTVGEKYEFCIESEARHEKTGQNFFTLRDKLGGFVHRFFFNGERKEGPGEFITLKVEKFTPKGRLLLVEPGTSISAAELEKLERIENSNQSRENSKLEYKSSFVFTASKSEANIDVQLDKEIMQQLAGFMNADGGVVYLGYRDNGTICGINNDIPYLNSSTRDSRTYEPTLDHIELKIRNRIFDNLGGLANSLVDISFRKTENDLLVCHLAAKPAAKPIFLGGTELFKRSGNVCQRLKGDEITFFVIEHLTKVMQNAKLGVAEPDFSKTPDASEQTKEVTPEEKKTPVAISHTPPAEAKEKVWRYITLYSGGAATKQRIAVEGADVLFNIPLTASAKNKSSRLLLCYDNGCVNILKTKAVAEEKFKKEAYRYANGFNTKANLVAVFVCCTDDFLVIRSKRLEDNSDMIKAVAIENYAGHEGQSMHSPGNKILETKEAILTEYDVVEAAESNFVRPVFMKSKNSVPGICANSIKAQSVLSYLKKRKRSSEAEDLRS